MSEPPNTSIRSHLAYALAIAMTRIRVLRHREVVDE